MLYINSQLVAVASSRRTASFPCSAYIPSRTSQEPMAALLLRQQVCSPSPRLRVPSSPRLLQSYLYATPRTRREISRSTRGAISIFRDVYLVSLHIWKSSSLPRVEPDHPGRIWIFCLRAKNSNGGGIVTTMSAIHSSLYSVGRTLWVEWFFDVVPFLCPAFAFLCSQNVTFFMNHSLAAASLFVSFVLVYPRVHSKIQQILTFQKQNLNDWHWPSWRTPKDTGFPSHNDLD